MHNLNASAAGSPELLRQGEGEPRKGVFCGESVRQERVRHRIPHPPPNALHDTPANGADRQPGPLTALRGWSRTCFPNIRNPQHRMNEKARQPPITTPTTTPTFAVCQRWAVGQPLHHPKPPPPTATICPNRQPTRPPAVGCWPGPASPPCPPARSAGCRPAAAPPPRPATHRSGPREAAGRTRAGPAEGGREGVRR